MILVTEKLKDWGAIFDAGTDLSLGIEEELQILAPRTLELTNAFEHLQAVAPRELQPWVKGELIASEIEVATCCAANFAEVAADLQAKHEAMVRLAAAEELALCATGVHPFSPWADQRTIDTEHYRRVEEGLRYVAWRNNTFSFHVHIGVRGRERAIRACDALRTFLPHFLALSASSPFYEGRYTYLHSTRTQLFTKNFPRCGIPDAFGNWAAYQTYLDFLFQSHSIEEVTQIWWSVRPHLTWGTVEVRICDAQPLIKDTLAMAALIVAVAARVLQVIDADGELPVYPRGYIEENFWRAVRYGLAGQLVDLATGREVPAVEAIWQLLDWTAEFHQPLGLEDYVTRLSEILRQGNWAMRQIAAYEQGMTITDIQRWMTKLTMHQETGRKEGSVGE